jgi:branched-chain amino acid aminotransferase
MNGEFIPWNKAKVHVLSHSLHYGSGVFEGIRFYETVSGKTAVFRLEEHVERLFFSAKTLEMEIPYTKKEIEQVILNTIRKNNVKAGYIRPIIFYGYGKMGLNPKGAELDICIAVWPWGSYLGEDMITVKTSSIIRIHPKSSETKAKITGHYANSIQAHQEAVNAGFNEALLLDFEGNVAEGPGENIFMVKDNTLITPSEGNILIGVTRDSIFKIAKDNNIKVIEKKLSLDELKQADEAFFTGTAAEVTPIKQIDESRIGDGNTGQITIKLKTLFEDAIHGKIDRYSEWLTYV